MLLPENIIWKDENFLCMVMSGDDIDTMMGHFLQFDSTQHDILIRK